MSRYRITIRPVHGESSEAEFMTLDELCAARSFWGGIVRACFAEPSDTTRVTVTGTDGEVIVELLDD